MKCWVCKRQARGYGHTDGRHKTGDPHRYPIDWVFCSTRCQNIFHAMYGNWVRGQDDPERLKEVVMIDPTDIELAAMRACLPAFGEAAGEIGFTKPLGDYSEVEALRVINVIVTGYTMAMSEHHEATRFPPVHGMKSSVSDPFADLESDIPWKEMS